MRRYTIGGDEATATSDLHSKKLTLSSPGFTEVLESDPDTFSLEKTYLTAMREMLEAINLCRPSSQPIEEGLRAVTIIARCAIKSASSK